MKKSTPGTIQISGNEETVTDRRSILSWLPVVGILLYAIILWKTGLTNIVNTLEEIDFRYLLPTPFLLLSIAILKGLKWKCILTRFEFTFTLRQCIYTWLIGTFAGALTPGQVGEAVKATYVRKRNPNRSFSDCLFTIVVEKILEIFSLFVLVMISSLIIVHDARNVTLVANIAVIVVFSLIILLIISHKKTYTVVKKSLAPPVNMVLTKRYKGILKESIQNMFLNVTCLRKDWYTLAYLMLLALVSWFVVYLHLYMLMLSLGIHIDFVFVLTILPIISFVAAIPVSVSGIGTKDAITIFFFKRMGLPMEAAVSWVLLGVVMGRFFNIAGWIFSLTSSKWLNQ